LPVRTCNMATGSALTGRRLRAHQGTGEAERRERGSDAGQEGPEPEDTVTARRVLL